MSDERKPATIEELRACIGRRVAVTCGHPEDGDYDEAVGPLLSVDEDGVIEVADEKDGDTRYFHALGRSGAQVSLLDGSGA